MAISKSGRFKIFERDNFTCQYCGKRPPDAILHVDHIHPKSKNGTDDAFNLTTACADCNLGKKDRILKNPERKISLDKEIENLKESQKQIEEYYKFLKKRYEIKEKNPIIDLISEEWERQSGGEMSLSEQGKKQMSLLLKKHSPDEIIEALRITWGKNIQDSERFKYMCGVLKNFYLRKINPEMARQKEQSGKDYYELLEYWKKQRRGSGYLPKYTVDKWLQVVTKEEIKEKMDITCGMWTDLKEEMEILIG